MNVPNVNCCFFDLAEFYFYRGGLLIEALCFPWQTLWLFEALHLHVIVFVVDLFVMNFK